MHLFICNHFTWQMCELYNHYVHIFLIIFYWTPWRVTTILLELAWFLCSQSQIPCQLPRFNLPFVIGIVTLGPTRAVFACPVNCKPDKNSLQKFLNITVYALLLQSAFSLVWHCSVHQIHSCGAEASWLVRSRLISPGSSHDRRHCVAFLGKALYSHSASLHPGV